MPFHPSRATPVLDALAALATGGLLTLMVHLNGAMAKATTPLFSSLAAHGVGAIAAALMLLMLRRRAQPAPVSPAPAPLWAYLGGLSGAVTVILTSTTVNSAIALSGTLALGLAGQAAFALATDRWGLFGLPRRRPGPRDLAGLALVLAGSAALIFGD
jgi:transporter family-2 protein